MSEHKIENVSSLVDNYRNGDINIDDVINDSNLSATWERYHLISNVMRRETADNIHLDLSSSIADAIANEPTILAPQKTTLSEKIKAKIIPLTKPFSQIAIAASAAGLMIIGVQQNTTRTEDFFPENQVVKTNPLGGFAQPVSLNYRQTTPRDARALLIERQRRLQALLADHQQQLKLNSSVDSDDQLPSTQDVTK